MNDIILKAMAPDVALRYPRASDLLEEVLSLRTQARRPVPPASVADAGDSRAQADGGDAAQAPVRPRPREVPPGNRFCWQCRKPLHARTDRCPFCGERQ